MSNVPSSLQQNIGKLMVAKGVTDDGLLKLYQWDSVDSCRGENCPAYDRCRMSKDSTCGMQVACVRSVLDLVYDNYEEYLTEPLLFQIGMHMLPMYKILSKMLVSETDLDVMYTNEKGDFKMNPLFKEIREQIKCISSLWRDLGLPIHTGDVRSHIPGNTLVNKPAEGE